MTTNKSTIPAVDQIRPNSGLRLNRLHKRRREARWNAAAVGFERSLAALNWLFCLFYCETDRTARLASKQVSNSADLRMSPFFFFRATPTQRLQIRGRAKPGREDKTPCVTPCSHLVKHWKRILEGSTLSHPVNYPPHPHFLLTVLWTDSGLRQ